MEQIKSAKLNKTLTSQDVTTHLKVLRSSGGTIQSLIAVPWKRGRGEQGLSSGIQQVTGVCSPSQRQSQHCVFLCRQILSSDLTARDGFQARPVQLLWGQRGTGVQDRV